MALWPVVLGALVLGLLGALHLLGVFRRRRPGEPPLDRGLVPWLGHIFDFRHDSASFLSRMERRHGDIFTVLLGGNYFTFVLDPLSYGAVVKEARSRLDFDLYARELVFQVFGYRGPREDHGIIVNASVKHLMGQGLGHMTQAMMENLAKVLPRLEGPGAAGWRHDELFHFSYSLVFHAGYLTLFGCKEEAGSGPLLDNIFWEFRQYDRLFPRLAYSVLSPWEKTKVEQLKRHFWDRLSCRKMGQWAKMSPWIVDQQRSLDEQGTPQSMLDRFNFMMLWASQGNTGPASFWALFFLLKHPEALRAVRAEVDGMLREAGWRGGSSLCQVTYDMLQRTPVLDSVMEETLRLTAGPILIRSILQDMTLDMADGRRFALRRGDRLALFPHLAVHLDPEIHPEPHAFKYDRFLGANGSRKVDFFKNSKRVKYYSMPWGAGVSICPGRFFATNEMKLFTFLMVAHFDLELEQPEAEIPPFDKSRWGFGIMQPTADVPFRYRPRF
ncbi:5-beta-cholestane-3-alpha,7-alpha-diol 12-alpha-hydroxylase [Tachyglossus aculeatus]|uniref:5-beta-cholestane-3-alpha,7-alpha-diol 12-alpha-hydroxylase n=1 Tax=Tachyglossus aculeatus TaxID=9261 RepID=UPI0018F375A0|nr:5-beta-cholestane-3-alpha,7-alpha-diol 12-alpha-hydroxylase [Tachyglossus aculeatus]